MKIPIREKVCEDINEKVFEGESVDFFTIASVDSSKDALGLVNMQNNHRMERLIKNVFTGVDFVATPEHFNAILVKKPDSGSSGNSILIDKKWSRPKIFFRRST